MLTVACGESAISGTQVQLWIKEGREDVNNVARPSHQSTSRTDGNIEAVKKMIFR